MQNFLKNSCLSFIGIILAGLGIPACSGDFSEKNIPVKTRTTGEERASGSASDSDSEAVLEGVVTSPVTGPESRVSTSEIERSPQELIFEIPENPDVEVEFSEPIMVTGAQLTDVCEQQTFQAGVPVFADLPLVPGEYIFCMRVLKNSVVVALSQTPPVFVIDHEANGQSREKAAKSCREVLSVDREAVSGLYWINPTGKEPFQAYCDMDSAGGGWTLVAAQFEADDMTNWGEGIQSDYDPLLNNGKSFSLSDEQIPAHTHSSFGKGLDSDFVGYAKFVYHTGDIPLTEVQGSDGQQYQIHRSKDHYYHWHNPEELLREVAAWQNALTFDLMRGRHYSWSYSPMVEDERGRGLGMLGNQRYISDTYAWTVWVR